MNPGITCLMPVKISELRYSQFEWLREAVDSALCQRQLSQLLIIDDGSTISIKELFARQGLQDSRIVIHSNPVSFGVARSLNRALGLVETEYVARLDSDDVWSQDKLRLQLEYMTENPELALYYGSMTLIDEHGRRLKSCDRSFTHDNTIKSGINNFCPIPHGSILVRTAALKSIGGYSYSPESIHAEDFATWQTLMRFYLVRGSAENFLLYRLHGGSVSSTEETVQKLSSLEISKSFTLLVSESDIRELAQRISKIYSLSLFESCRMMAVAWSQHGMLILPQDVLNVAKKVFYDRRLVPAKMEGRYMIMSR